MQSNMRSSTTSDFFKSTSNAEPSEWKDFEDEEPPRQFSTLGYKEAIKKTNFNSFVSTEIIEPAISEDLEIASPTSNEENFKNEAPPLSPPPQSPSPSFKKEELQFINHFSSEAISSSTIRFRSTKLRLYGDSENQFVIENDESKNKITVKHVKMSSFGLNLLRSAYTLVATLVFGFLFVFCFQVILFLFFNLAADSSDGHAGAVVGTLFSIPIFIFGFASVMVLGWLFVKETWHGHKVIKNIVNLHPTLVEWMTLLVFLGVPILTLTITLFQGLGNWWEITALVWVSCVFVFMIVFAICIVTTEIITYFRIIRLHFNPMDGDESKWTTFWKLLLQAIYLRQKYAWSGTQNEKYLVKDDEFNGTDGYIANDNYTPIKVTTSWYTKFTALNFNHTFYDTLDTPQRIYTLYEILDLNTAIVTKDNWSLETMFCSVKQGKIVSGKKHGLTLSQVRSSIACQLLGSLLILLLIIALLVWLQAANPAIIVLVVVISILVCFWPILKSVIPLFQSLSLAVDDDVDVTTFHVWESLRITQPKKMLAYGLFLTSFLVIFLYPLISLFITNQSIAYVFLFLGTFSFLRLNFNVSYLLADLGSIQNVSLHLSHDRKLIKQSILPPTLQTLFRNSLEEETLIQKEKSRIATIIQHTRGNFVNIWMYGYAIAFLLILLISLSGYNSVTDGKDGSQYKIKGATFVDGFGYKPRYRSGGAVGDLMYQTCTLDKGFGFPSNVSDVESAVQLQDFAFMATSAYMGPDEAQPVLDKYFGEGKVIDEYKFVQKYRNQTGSVGGVSYKLFSFVDYPGYAVMSIRGSETLVDWIVNIQLWSCAVLAQFVRFVMPLGNMWTPIYYRLVKIANAVQSENLRKISYYRSTSSFVNDVMNGWDDNSFSTLRVTGVSLGGGIAIITGAQTGASTVAISGPNAMMSRQTFDPPLTVEQLNSRILNVIPARDIIAHIDDPANLYQRIECRAPMYSLFGCHSMYRSLCEYAFQCGSNGRPVLCWCVSKYGYPIPEQFGETSWEEACKDA